MQTIIVVLEKGEAMSSKYNVTFSFVAECEMLDVDKIPSKVELAEAIKDALVYEGVDSAVVTVQNYSWEEKR